MCVCVFVFILLLNGKNSIKSFLHKCITSKKLTDGSPKNKYCGI